MNQQADRVIRSRATYDVQLDRHEGKYIISRSMLPAIREFIRPFCESDPHCKGNPPRYVITTLQLDDARLSLHHAKANEAVANPLLSQPALQVTLDLAPFLAQDAGRSLPFHVVVGAEDGCLRVAAHVPDIELASAVRRLGLFATPARTSKQD